MASAEDEVRAELEAVQAVYGSECTVLDYFPPHIHVYMKPRTADVTSQQFVEAVISIQGGPKYPEEPPCINLVDSKGLDEQRKKQLLNCICDKACEISPCLMLVALCEEAVEKLSLMNHPDGDCPLCLYPLFPERQQIVVIPFMKLMSCFHCFHSECIVRWWNWLETEKDLNAREVSRISRHPIRNVESQKVTHVKERIGNCPVCRKGFEAKDLEHVLDLVGSHSGELNPDATENSDDDNLIQSETEIVRRKKFEAILKLQEEKSGIVEPKREIAVLPGISASRQTPVTETSDPLPLEQPEQLQRHHQPQVTSRTNSSRTPSWSGSSGHRNFGPRTTRSRNQRKPVQEWVRKDNTPL